MCKGNVRRIAKRSRVAGVEKATGNVTAKAAKAHCKAQSPTPTGVMEQFRLATAGGGLKRHAGLVISILRSNESKFLFHCCSYEQDLNTLRQLVRAVQTIFLLLCTGWGNPSMNSPGNRPLQTFNSQQKRIHSTQPLLPCLLQV